MDASLPSVFVGRPWNMPDRLSYVDTDNEHAGELAMLHLLGRGRRRIGTVAGPPDMTSSHDRLAGWRSALTADRLLADAVEYGDFTTPGRSRRRNGCCPTIRMSTPTSWRPT